MIGKGGPRLFIGARPCHVVRAEGRDDPAVVTAITLVRWELSTHVDGQNAGNEPT